jgi:hypothetical protein
MEFVDGEDLADRIAHGPILADETLRIAKRIADALEVAHEPIQTDRPFGGSLPSAPVAGEIRRRHCQLTLAMARLASRGICARRDGHRGCLDLRDAQTATSR